MKMSEASFGGISFPVHEYRSQETPLDASELLAAALEQMDDIIAASAHEYENQPLEKQDSSSKTHSINDKFGSDTFFTLNVPKTDIHLSENKVPVNKMLDQLKDCIISRSDANENVVPNGDINVSSAKVVLTWLQKLLKEYVSDSQINDFFSFHVCCTHELRIKNIIILKCLDKASVKVFIYLYFLSKFSEMK
ncbi:uncharacterized protein LOC118185809 [Stegodyphus dumicola]|uniref:uncharacterized protein LOC118185809 n=1 Tax=Stegodyphus dumicola TaxID=202533 RepID=UPI0015B22421|nr:uncharacterized protein LOC118185809 [Stegodyphus dumicola]